MLTPLDIKNKHFTKSLRGYKETEVEDYLAMIVETMEALIRVNIETTAKNRDYEKQLTHYIAMEHTITEAMILAQKTSDDMIKNANERAAYIIERADDQAKNLISDANNEVLSVIKRHEDAKHALQAFQMKFKSLVENQIKAYDEHLD